MTMQKSLKARQHQTMRMKSKEFRKPVVVSVSKLASNDLIDMQLILSCVRANIIARE
jgi:hypothetical protein